MSRYFIWVALLSAFATPAWADTQSPSGNDLLLMAAALYFLPFLIALSRGHMSSGAIFLVNLIFGWTALGWVVALIWSFTGNTRRNLRQSITGTVTVREIGDPDAAPGGGTYRGNIIVGKGEGPAIRFRPTWR